MNFGFPEYIMIKFKVDNSNIERASEVINLSKNSRDYERSFIKKDIEKKDKVPKKQENIGISSGLGIQRAVNMIDTKLRENTNLINSSFTGIESLRQNATKLVEIGSQLKSKLDKTNEKESSEINQVLQKIGYIDPVTKDQAGKEYIKELSFQIQKFFEEYFKYNVGVLTLIDAYCIFNRARGMSKIFSIIFRYN